MSAPSSALSSAPSSAHSSISVAALLKNLPVLKLRKDIWENFPVCLEKMDESGDHRDRYLICWHYKQLARWSQQIPQYASITKIRLVRALNANKTAWTIRDAPTGTDAICMLEMLLPSERPTILPQNITSLMDPTAVPPVINTLDDIRDNYPVCWIMQPDGSAVLSFHERQVRRLAELMNCPINEIHGIVHEKLLAGLWNGGWIIDASNIPANGLCTVCKATSSLIHA
jgi:hypothetical protein